MEQVSDTMVVRFEPASLDDIPLGAVRRRLDGPVSYVNRAAREPGGTALDAPMSLDDRHRRAADHPQRRRPGNVRSRVVCRPGAHADLLDKTRRQLRRADLPLERLVRLASGEEGHELALKPSPLRSFVEALIPGRRLQRRLPGHLHQVPGTCRRDPPRPRAHHRRQRDPSDAP